jgi:hypothetical protein
LNHLPLQQQLLQSSSLASRNCIQVNSFIKANVSETKQEEISGLLPSDNINVQIPNPLADILPGNPKPYKHEAEYFEVFLTLMRALWAYSYFIVKVNLDYLF